MKAKDLRSKPLTDLQFAKVRKNIARVKTVLAQSKASGGKT